MTSPQIQVITDADALPPELQSALDRSNAQIIRQDVHGACNQTSPIDADAVIVVTGHPQGEPSDYERLFETLAKQPRGTLVITSGPVNGLGSVTRPPELPISFAESPTADEIAVRITTLCEMSRSLRHMADKAQSMMRKTQRLADEAHVLDEQLRLARQVQSDFLPRRVPECQGVRFLTLFRPVDYVSGDIYDLARLDEGHIGLAVADVTGHGVPAALLTLFVKRSWRAKEISGNAYRIIPPDELLYRLNRDVLEADLEQCQFVTACCAIYDQRSRIITWARGGLPYPILIRPGEGVRRLRSSGELVGAFEEANFELCQEQLKPGDRMVFFTDGLEALLLGASPQGLDEIEETAWFARLGELPLEDQIDDIHRRLNGISARDWPCDDVTIVAVAVDA